MCKIRCSSKTRMWFPTQTQEEHQTTLLQTLIDLQITWQESQRWPSMLLSQLTLLGVIETVEVLQSQVVCKAPDTEERRHMGILVEFKWILLGMDCLQEIYLLRICPVNSKQVLMTPAWFLNCHKIWEIKRSTKIRLSMTCTPRTWIKVYM